MMLHRSASSRRRRASRSFANSSGQSAETSPTEPTMRAAGGRRASVATEKPIFLLRSGPNALTLPTERHRSPRGSIVPDIVPDIALDIEEASPPPLAEVTSRRFLPDPEQCSNASRVQTETSRSPRSSLIPDESYRSPRGSLVPEPARSPRNSLVPDIGPMACSSPRNSLTPDSPPIVPRSPRHSIAPEAIGSSRCSLAAPEIGYNRSPRNSLIPGGSVTGARSPRHSLVCSADLTTVSTATTITTTASTVLSSSLPVKSPRGSMVNLDSPDHHSPRGSIGFDAPRSPRGSLTANDVAAPSGYGRSPRGSLVSEYQNPQSPRGSICPVAETGSRSPRGSIGPHYEQIVNRSSSFRRGSLGHDVTTPERRIRAAEADGEDCISPRGSITGEPSMIERSPRASCTGKPGLPGQIPRKSSGDQGVSKSRNSYAHGQREIRSGSVKSNGSGGQTTLGYGTNAWIDSRRASSSVSQVSADESRRLCGSGGGGGGFEGGKLKSLGKDSTGSTGAANLRIATYGSLAFLLKDAHLEASGFCDFVFRALTVVRKTTIFTICLGCLSTMPILMFILGLQFRRDCPIEPRIPFYMVVGGTLGTVQMFWALYSQIRSRRPEASAPAGRSSCQVSPMMLASIALSCFLVGWFAVGNYWILKIKWPAYAPTLFEPNEWCHKTLYIFSLVHLCVVYAALGASLLVAVGLAFCRFLACLWPERYK